MFNTSPELKAPLVPRVFDFGGSGSLCHGSNPCEAATSQLPNIPSFRKASQHQFRNVVSLELRHYFALPSSGVPVSVKEGNREIPWV
jgi:hypothetical protein